MSANTVSMTDWLVSRSSEDNDKYTEPQVKKKKKASSQISSIHFSSSYNSFTYPLHLLSCFQTQTDKWKSMPL